MRKILLPAFLVLVSAAVAAYFLSQRSRPAASASLPEPVVVGADLAPADTLAFATLPDLARTLERWPKTALYTMWQEPQVQAFLVKPKANVPYLQDLDSFLSSLDGVKPRQAFVAVTSLEGDNPKGVFGLQYDGPRSAVDKAIAGPRTAFKETYPAGKAELLQHRGTEIQTYADNAQVMAEAFRDHWYFVSSDLNLLRAVLDRYEAKAKGKPVTALVATEPYREALAPLPPESDIYLYLQPKSILQNLAGLFAMMNQQAPTAEDLQEVEAMKAMSFSLKMDGADFVDSWFVYSAQPPSPERLSRRGLAFTTPDTTLFYAGVLPPNFAHDVAALGDKLPQLAETAKALKEKGLNLLDTLSALGPEFSFSLEWPADGTPAPCFALDVRDARKVRTALEALEAGGAWKCAAAGDTLAYIPPPLPSVPFFTPAIAVTENSLLIALGVDPLVTLMNREKSQEPNLASAQSYRELNESLPAPTDSFGFLHTERFVGQAHPSLLQLLNVSIFLSTEMGNYMDFPKVPQAPALSKHLGTTAYSRSATAKGLLGESKGPITFSQALLGTSMVYGLAAFPLIQPAIEQSGLKLQLPGGAKPPAKIVKAIPKARATPRTIEVAPKASPSPSPTPALTQTPAPTAEPPPVPDAPVSTPVPAPAPKPSAAKPPGGKPPAKKPASTPARALQNR